MWNEPDRVRRDGPGGKRREDVRTLDGSSAIDLRLPPRLLGAYPYVAAPGGAYDRAWPFSIRISEKEVDGPPPRRRPVDAVTVTIERGSRSPGRRVLW